MTVSSARKIPTRSTGDWATDYHRIATALNAIVDTIPKLPTYAGFDLGEIFDPMSYTSALQLEIHWTQRDGGLPDNEISSVSDAEAPGGVAVRFGNNSGDDMWWGAFTDYLIPYDGLSLYEVGIIARKTAGSGAFWCGLEGVADDGATLINVVGADTYSSQHYVAATAVALGSSWEIRRGFVRGWSATPDTNNKNDARDPGQMYTGVAYVRPLFIVNYDGVAGTTDVGAVWVRRIDGELAATDQDDLEIPDSGINIASRGWSMTNAFAATDANTVSWGAGSFISADGTTYSIGAGNTGNMTARTYVYLDINVSTTAYQASTTATDAIGSGKVLVAVAEDTTTEAFFQVFGGIGGVLVTANEVAANSITTNEIAANTIVAGDIAATTITGTQIASMSISGKTLTADTGTVGGWTMASGSLSSGSITIHSGDEEILIGSATAPLTGTGIFIGSDAASSYDFRAGDPAGQYIHWDGSAGTLTIDGDLRWSNVKTFTPTWTGFSSDPSGDLDYIDFTTWAVIWYDGSSLLGTSNATSFTLSNLPAAITPAQTKTVTCICTNNGANALAVAAVQSSGNVSMQIFNAGTPYPFTATGWTASGSKGLGPGFFIVYPL